MSQFISATTTSFLQNYSTIWNEEGHLEISDTEFEFPCDLDPSHLGIEYTHGHMPDELECFVSGKFFVDNIAFLKPFSIYFCTFFDAREVYFFVWDGNRLTTANEDFVDLIEDHEDLDDDDTWSSALEGNLPEELIPEDIDYVIWPEE